MPTDTTYVHFIDSLGANGPMWLFCIGLLTIIAFVVIKALPTWHDIQMRRLELDGRAEDRKANELKMRNEREMEMASNNARMIDAMHDTADSNRAIATAMSTLSTDINISRGNSAQMGSAVSETHDMVGDIHAVIVQGKRVV